MRNRSSVGSGPSLQARGQRLPFEILHHKEVHAILRVEIMNRGDIGMIQPREGLGLLVEALTGRFVSEGAGWQDLQGHVALEPLVAGAIDFTHAARANLLHDAVMAKHRANHDEGTRPWHAS